MAIPEAEAFNLVENRKALIEIFSYWPSFHDAEILSFTLDRGDQNGPWLDARIHVFEPTQEIDNKGFFVLRHHTIVTLHFEDVQDVMLDSFNHQNVLWNLEVAAVPNAVPGEPGLSVSMLSSYGCSAEFVCRRVSVTGVESFPPRQ